jgi:HK97 family phage major capsid protein/HK97 family phage prohead protease
MTDFVRNSSAGDVRADEATGSITVSLSSEEPYRRFDGVEILDHSDDAVDLSWLNSGNAPLLDNHDRYTGLRAQIGVVVRAWLEEKRLYVEVRFSNRADAQDIRRDILDGIIRNVSVGYERIKIGARSEGGDDTYRVTKWKPMEASFVTVPADQSVGIGRATETTQEGIMPPIEDTTPSTPEAPVVRSAAPATVPALPVAQPAPADRSAETNAAMADIYALAASHSRSDMATAYIDESVRSGQTPSYAAFQGRLRAAIPADTPMRNTDIGLTPRETRQFSIMALARSMRDGATSADVEAAAFEIEASNAARDAAPNDGRTSRGMYSLPSELMRSWGDFEVDGVRAAIGTGAGGANILDTTHLSNRFIDNLRNRSGVMRAGATMLAGLDNHVEIPGGQANNVAAWLAAEDANVAESNPTFRKVTLAPKDLGSYVDLTRRMLQQSTIALEAYVRKQITDGIVLEIDRAALYGTGATGQPTGLNATAGIGSIAFAAAATTGIPTREELIDMRKLVAVSNRGTESLKWLFNSSSLGDMQKTRIDAGSGMFLIQDSNERLIGNPFIETNQIPVGPTLNDVWLGFWEDMLIGLWGSLDLDRDTAAKFLAGGIRLRGIQTVDVAAQRVGSFVKGT